MKVKTAVQAFKTGTPTLVSMELDAGRKTVINYIKIWLISLNDYLNVTRKLQPAQINEIAHYIYSEYYYLQIADIYLVFTDIKKGKYGQLYEGLDGIKLLSFFNQYAQERSESIFYEGLNDHAKTKEFELKRTNNAKRIHELMFNKT